MADHSETGFCHHTFQASFHCSQQREDDESSKMHLQIAQESSERAFSAILSGRNHCHHVGYARYGHAKVRKGTRPEISMGDNHDSFVVFSAADPIHGRLHYRISDSPSNQHKVVAFLKQMRQRYPRERLLFILDNARPHTAQSVKKFAQEDGNMYLVYLPKYTSLTLNAIERLFKWFRRVVTHNYYFEASEQLKQAIRAFFQLVSKSPKRLINLLSQDRNSLFQSL
jgi:transposase